MGAIINKHESLINCNFAERWKGCDGITMKPYSFLNPIQVGNTTLKNRIIYPAMGKSLASEDGYVTDRYIEYFRNIARGGVAMITTGIMVIDPEWHYISVRQPWLSDDRFLPGLRKLTEAIHREDCRIMFQPWQSGEAGQPTGGDAPDPVTVNDLSLEEIRRIQQQWFDASRRAKEAGADGIEFHLAHTYLPSQFMSPYFNHRTDAYGSDTIENSLRFSLEIIDRIMKELVDDTFMVTAKINGDDFVPGGTTIRRTVEACKLLERAGVAMITVNGGGALTDITGMSDNGRRPEGWKVPFAEAVKHAVRIPVAASGSLRHPEFVDGILRAGKCDLAAIGRGILAEPEWVRKAAEGREDEMRCCISCMFCFSRTEEGTAGCSVNPFAKRELEKKPLVRDGNGRTVVVAGAGPAGLEAAVTLAERGFRVRILEKRGDIGGLVAFAALPPGKAKLNWMLDYYRRQIQRLGIRVRLNTEATAERIAEEEPYAVVLACGSREFIPEIEGIHGRKVVGYRQVFEKIKDEADGTDPVDGENLSAGNGVGTEGAAVKNVVILGGGLTGVELAHLLKSRGCSVEILELLPPPENPSMEQKLALAAAGACGVELLYRQKVERISEGTVQGTDLESGRKFEKKADLIIRSMGIRPEDSLEETLRERYGDRLYRIGDCRRNGKISTAVSDGADLGYELH